MVVILSDKESRTENEISEVLYLYGCSCISDSRIRRGRNGFTAVSLHRKTELKINSGVVLIPYSCKRFAGQSLPVGLSGICEAENRDALLLFEKNRIPVISCGMDSRNTVTVSSLSENTLVVSLRRTVTDINGRELEPADYRINFVESYSPFSVMSAVAALLLLGITSDRL